MINISIEARMTSTRLPGKSLKLINGKPSLEIMVDRVRQAKMVNKIVIATTKNKKDDDIVNWCELNKINYFRGSENNVFDRVLKTHQKFNTKTIVELTGDCILITAEMIDYAIKLYLKNDYEYVNIKDPFSMSVQVYSLQTLQSVKDKKILGYLDKEHVTPYLYTSGEYKILRTEIYKNFNFQETCLTLDTIEDWEVLNKICRNFDNFLFSFEEIAKFIKKNPAVISNKHINRKGLT